MTKSELVTTVSISTGIPEDVALKALNATLSTITNVVGHGESVVLPGFGTFSRKHREERKGRNPQTGEELIVPAANVPSFKAGKKLKEAANSK